MIATREICKICYNVVRVGFNVPDEVWEGVVYKEHLTRVLCIDCFTKLADEKLIEWDTNIEFYPVSLKTHLQGVIDTMEDDEEIGEKPIETERIYLAIPYTIDPERAFVTVNEVAAILMHNDFIVYSPITQSHPISLANELPSGWDFWEKLDTAFIKWSDTLLLVDLKDKDDNSLIPSSTGCQAEIEIAKKHNKNIKLYNLDTNEIIDYNE